MNRFRLRRPRHVTVVAYLALFVAMGGTGYAALKLPKNSVGSKQLKKNAVRSSKVKDRSLLANDFKAGQLPPGPEGLRGVPGLKGDRGLTGPTFGSSNGGVSVDVPSKPYDLPTTGPTNHLFTTPFRGRLLVQAVDKQMSQDCTAGFGTLFVTLDGTAIPGSQKMSAAGTPYLTTVVTEPVAAGQHVLAFAADCPAGNTTTTNFFGDGDISEVLLGG